jgi:hypothetical protein
VLPACFVLLAAAVLSSAPGQAPAGRVRFGLAACAVVAIAALALPLAAALHLRASQRDVEAGRLQAAL